MYEYQVPLSEVNARPVYPEAPGFLKKSSTLLTPSTSVARARSSERVEPVHPTPSGSVMIELGDAARSVNFGPLFLQTLTVRGSEPELGSRVDFAAALRSFAAT